MISRQDLWLDWFNQSGEGTDDIEIRTKFADEMLAKFDHRFPPSETTSMLSMENARLRAEITTLENRIEAMLGIIGKPR